MVRYKNRYFISEYKFCPGEKPLINKAQLLQLIEDEIQRLHGDFGTAAVRYGFDVKYLNPHTNIVVIRARHGPHRLVASVIPIIRKRVVLRMLRLTATIIQAFKFIKNYQLHMLELSWESFQKKNLTENEKKTLEGLKDVSYLNTIGKFVK